MIGPVRNVSVSALTKNLANALGSKGVNVTVVHPGITRTEALVETLAARSEADGVSVEELEDQLARNTIGRVIDASEVADVVAFLASPRSAITGDAIAAGGRLTGPVFC